MLKLEKRERVFFDNEEIDFEKVDLSEFYISNLLTKTVFGDGLTMEGLLNHYLDLREFVFTYFSEYYDKTRTVITSARNNKNYSSVRFFKRLVIEEGFVYFTPCYEFIEEKKGLSEFQFLSQLPVYIDEEIEVVEESAGEYVNNKKLHCDITFMDISECLFHDISNGLTEDSI